MPVKDVAGDQVLLADRDLQARNAVFPGPVVRHAQQQAADAAPLVRGAHAAGHAGRVRGGAHKEHCAGERPLLQRAKGCALRERRGERFAEDLRRGGKGHRRAQVRKLRAVLRGQGLKDHEIASFFLQMQKRESALRSPRFSWLGPVPYTTPWASMASATFLKPAMLAPATKLPSTPKALAVSLALR